MTPESENTHDLAELCYRCGYDLRATPDDRPCPECGLLAARSRRPNDELRFSRPRWLSGLALGAGLVAAVVIGMALAEAFALIGCPQLWTDGDLGDFELPLTIISLVLAGGFIAGIVLLTRSEGYAPADRADRIRRMALRLAAALVGLSSILFLVYVQCFARNHWSPLFLAYMGPLGTVAFWWPYAAAAIGTWGLAMGMLLLFLQLRGLAKRARSAGLAEHATIVGIGTAVAVVFSATTLVLTLRYGTSNSSARSALNEPMFFDAIGIGTVANGLFVLWSIYLLVRFSRSFLRAARLAAEPDAEPQPLPDSCFRCGYDLRASDDAGVCPECAFPVETSRVENQKLRFTTPRWWRQLVYGLIYYQISVLALVIWPIGGGLICELFRIRGDEAMYVVLGGWLVFAGLLYVGILNLTRPQGYWSIDRNKGGLRWGARVAGVAPLIAALWALLYWGGGSGFYLSSYGEQETALTASLAALGTAPLPLLLYLHIRRLVGRARKDRLRLDCSIVGIGTAATLVYGAICIFCQSQFDELRYHHFGLFAASTMLLVVSAIVFYLWNLYLPVKLAIAFKAAERVLNRAAERTPDQPATLPGTQLS